VALQNTTFLENVNPTTCAQNGVSCFPIEGLALQEFGYDLSSVSDAVFSTCGSGNTLTSNNRPGFCMDKWTSIPLPEKELFELPETANITSNRYNYFYTPCEYNGWNTVMIYPANLQSCYQPAASEMNATAQVLDHVYAVNCGNAEADISVTLSGQFQNIAGQTQKKKTIAAEEYDHNRIMSKADGWQKKIEWTSQTLGSESATNKVRGITQRADIRLPANTKTKILLKGYAELVKFQYEIPFSLAGNIGAYCTSDDYQSIETSSKPLNIRELLGLGSGFSMHTGETSYTGAEKSDLVISTRTLSAKDCPPILENQVFLQKK